jgi:ribosomal protein S18 acetylase RimI-like enzyme
MWSTALQQNPQETIVAIEGNELVGFSNFGRYLDSEDNPGTSEIRAIYILEQYWRKGIGTALLKFSIEKIMATGCAVAVLWVLKTNTGAISFYSRHGFRFDGLKKTATLWGIDLDEIRMSKSLCS